MRILNSIVFGLWATTAIGQASDPEATELSNGVGLSGIEATIANLSTNIATNGFEIGMLQTLQAVEKTLQLRYEYGLGDRITGLPILRLEIGNMRNPTPKGSTPETLAMIMDGFVRDIAIARASLAAADKAGIVPFELAIEDIWFDVNGNGTREPAESMFSVLGPVVLGRRGFREVAKSDDDIQDLTIRFDEADHAWLAAYTNMLSGIGNLFMAFDPTPILQDLADRRTALANAPEIPNIYDPEKVKADIEILEAKMVVAKAKRVELSESRKLLSARYAELGNQKHAATDDAVKDSIQAEYEAVRSQRNAIATEGRQVRQSERFLRNEKNAAMLKLPNEGNMSSSQKFLSNNSPAIDAAYVVIKALAQQPDKARIQAAHADLRAMIHNNRVFWDRLAQETDNDHEWIPNRAQESAMPFVISDEMAEGWQSILADVEAVLEGDLLIHHPLLPSGVGISIPVYVADPSPLEIVGWLHGADAYRYAAKGPRLTGQSWQAFQRLTLGRASGFAFLLN